MALWIQNVTPDDQDPTLPDLYEVKINRNPPLATFTHDRTLGAAQCLRDAAAAIVAANPAPAPTGVAGPSSTVLKALQAGLIYARIVRDLHVFVDEPEKIEAMWRHMEYINSAIEEVRRGKD